MIPQDKLQTLAKNLNNFTTEYGLILHTEMLSGEVDVLVLTIEDREEFPIYITLDEEQMLCVTHLWKESEVDTGKHTALLDVLLSANVSMPLSSFSKVGSQYIIFGALSSQAPLDEIIEEVIVLSNNTLTAVEELSEYLLK